MALPIIPIILAVTALGSGIVQGISQAKNAKAEAKAVLENAQVQMNERAKQARKLMSQQKTSYLKSGVYFDSGSPVDIINETYDTMKNDLNAMTKDTNAKVNNLMRQGKTAFFNSILEGVANGAMSFLGTQGMMKSLGSTGSSGSSLKDILGTFGSKISNSKAGTAVQNWYNSQRGWTRGGFGNVTGNADKIV
ncbi:hypothetical protein IJD34_04480 [bacterium]|nr:hypothetical protein [bacterium]